MNAVDSSKKRVEYDSKIKTSVRDMRIREDTAHYLLNLDDDSAYYGTAFIPSVNRPSDAKHARKSLPEVGEEPERGSLRRRELRSGLGRGERLPEDADLRLGSEHEGEQRPHGGSADSDRWGWRGVMTTSIAAEAGGGAKETAGGDAEKEARTTVWSVFGEEQRDPHRAGKRKLCGIRQKGKYCQGAS